MVALTTRIGIGLSPDTVCAVVARGREVIWSGIDVIDDEGTDAALSRIMQKLPKVSWPRPRVHAGVSDEYASIKTIRALPSIQNARTLAGIVAAAPGRFFISPLGAATPTGVRVVEAGVARAAIVRNDAIGAIRDACVQRGLTLARVVPGEIALSSLTDEELRDPCALGLGAVVLDRREPLVIRPAWRVADQPARVGRLRLAAAVAAISTIGALTIPVFAAKGNAAAARRELASLAPTRARALKNQRDLSDAANMFGELSRFERGRMSTTWLLGQIVKALPANTMLTSLKFDSATVTMTALAARATDVVREIQNMPGASNVEIIGAIAYEASVGSPGSATSTSSGTDLERVTIRFRVAPDPTYLRVPFVGETEAETR